MKVMDMVFSTVSAELLLNVDFIRDYDNVTWLEEMFYHTLISAVLYFLLLYVYHRFNDLYYYFLLFSMFTFCILYFVLMLLAEREIFTLQFTGFTIWVVGHILYLLFVWISIKYRGKVKFLDQSARGHTGK